MKRLLIMLLCIFMLIPANIKAASETVTSEGSGNVNVRFSNGYYGYCIDAGKKGTSVGEVFILTETNEADNNASGADVSQKLKVLFTQHFERIFVADGNGGYVIDFDVEASLVPAVIYKFTDDRYTWGEQSTLVDEINGYTGNDIPDKGYTKVLENGDVITFYFMVMKSTIDNVQSYFAYRIEVSKELPHEHDFTKDWQTNDDQHWKECECGEKLELDEHEGGEATCISKKECTTCGKEYGTFDLTKHTGNTEVRNAKPATTEEEGYTGDTHCKDCGTLLEKGEPIEKLHKHEFGDWQTNADQHWKECECGEKLDLDEHEGGEATCISKKKCSECGKEYGTLDTTKHTGNTELRNAKPATTEEEGYTGDTHCKDCGTLLVKGETIAKLHKHEFGDWQTDSEQHWKECECGEKDELDDHKGGEATCISKRICTVCGEEYGYFNSKNHKGEIELRGYKAPTTEEEGYTGDTHCKDCDALLEKGEPIEKLHKHEFSDWQTDSEQHWKECECGEKLDLDEHEGGEATCISKKKCSECGKEYGTLDTTKHTGNTELRNAKPATTEKEGYTGDTHCKDCGTLLEKGEPIEKLHKHEFGDWQTDSEQHWKECECGKKLDLDEHEGGEATCISKKKCSICGKEYGTFNLTKHTGNTEVRNAKPATTEEEGYTGDTHCKDCGTLLVKGEVIAKLHKHEFGDWKIDEENHWKECECKEKDALNKHEGGEATCISKKKCSVCGQEYGEFDSKNHKAEIEVRGYVAPTKDKEGYTGDTYCKDCNALIKKGTTLSKLGDTPNTADNSNILLWTLAMITSAACCLLLSIKKYKNN